MRYIGRVASALSRSNSVSTIILIGSYSRGDSDEDSDIDVVVVGRHNLSPSKLSKTLPPSTYQQKISMLPFSKTNFRAMYERGNLFLIHALSEGTVLYDDGYLESLRRAALPDWKEDTLREWNLLKLKIRMYDDVSVFNHVYGYCLARIYHMACHAAILGLALNGQLQFNKHKAISEFVRAYPEARDEMLNLARLRAYSLYSLKRPTKVTRPPPLKTFEDTESEIKALEKVVRVVDHAIKPTRN